MEDDDAALRPLPTLTSPQSLFGRISARVGPAEDFSELKRLTSSRLQLRDAEDGVQIRPDTIDTDIHRLVKHSVNKKKEQKKVCERACVPGAVDSRGGVARGPAGPL